MFGNDSLPTKIYTYGCNGGPQQNADLCREQLYLAHRYRNKLVEIERERRQAATAALLQFFPRLAEIDAELTEIDAQLEQRRDAIKRANVSRRKRGVSDPAKEATNKLKARAKDLRAEAKPLRQAAYTPPDPLVLARKRLAKFKRDTGRRGRVLEQQDGYREIADAIEREQAAWEQANPYAAALRQIDEAAHAAELRAREACGVFWGSYLQSEKAAKQAKQDALKLGVLPQFKRYQGEGMLAVQVQGGMSPAELTQGTDTRVRLIPTDKPRLHTLWLRVGSEGRDPVWATWEVIVPEDRPLPADCQIKEVHLVAHKIATHTKWEAQFVVSREGGFPDDRQAKSGTVAINFGFRRMDGNLRAAYYVGDDGEQGECLLTRDHLAQFSHVEHLRSVRDKLFDGVKETLACWLEGSPAPEWLDAQVAWLTQEVRKTKREAVKPIVRTECEAFKRWLYEWGEARPDVDAIKAILRPPRELKPGEKQAPLALRQWRAQAKLAAAVLRWREQRFAGDELIYAVLESWRKRDKHLYEWEGNLRQKALDRRQDVYRKFARELSSRYRVALVDNTDYRKLARLPKAEEENKLAKSSRSNRQLACVSSLRQYLAEAFADFVKADVQDMTTTCHACGAPADVPEGESGLRICPACGVQYDRDENLCKNLLRRAVP